MGTGELLWQSDRMQGEAFNPAMDWHPKQGEVAKLAASSHRNRYETTRSIAPIGWNVSPSQAIPQHDIIIPCTVA